MHLHSFTHYTLLYRHSKLQGYTQTQTQPHTQYTYALTRRATHSMEGRKTMFVVEEVLQGTDGVELRMTLADTNTLASETHKFLPGLHPISGWFVFRITIKVEIRRKNTFFLSASCSETIAAELAICMKKKACSVFLSTRH